jgi:spermidine synthase
LIGPRVGLLYACNTAGAITGAVLAGFVLIGGIGIGRSFTAAASINACVGLVALLLARWTPTTTAAETAPPADLNHRSPAGAESGSTEPTRALRRMIVVVFGLSGFAALALEVVWFRVLVTFVPATTYAFTSMLAAVLAGIAAGSATGVPVLRFRCNWVRVLGVLQALVGLLALAAMTFFLRLYRSGQLPDNVIAAALVVILPPAIVMGLAFPVGIRAFTRAEDQGSGQTAAHIAALYAANVGGAIGGAVAAGFLLVPSLGTRGSLVFLLASACSGWRKAARPRRPSTDAPWAAASSTSMGFTRRTIPPGRCSCSRPSACCPRRSIPTRDTCWR